jgi:hypothetical protein
MVSSPQARTFAITDASFSVPNHAGQLSVITVPGKKGRYGLPIFIIVTGIPSVYENDPRSCSGCVC